MLHPLKELREKFDLSQGDLAILADTSHTEISLIETGRKEPSEKVLKAIVFLEGNSVGFIEQHWKFVEEKKRSIYDRVLMCQHNMQNPN